MVEADFGGALGRPPTGKVREPWRYAPFCIAAAACFAMCGRVVIEAMTSPSDRQSGLSEVSASGLLRFWRFAQPR